MQHLENVYGEEIQYTGIISLKLRNSITKGKKIIAMLKNDSESQNFLRKNPK